MKSKYSTDKIPTISTALNNMGVLFVMRRIARDLGNNKWLYKNRVVTEEFLEDYIQSDYQRYLNEDPLEGVDMPCLHSDKYITCEECKRRGR